MTLSITALAAFEIEFKIAIFRRYCVYCVNGFFRKNRPSEVGVQHRAGEIKYSLKRSRCAISQFQFCCLLDRFFVWDRSFTGDDVFATFLQRVPQRKGYHLMAVLGDDVFRLEQKPIN